jgi:hypothetical protein
VEPDTPIRIEILNGCGQAGIARRTKAYLQEKGYDVLSIGDASEHFVRTIIVERRSSNNTNARSLARTLRLDESSVTRHLDSLSPVWVTLIIGDDYVDYLPDTVEIIQ